MDAKTRARFERMLGTENRKETALVGSAYEGASRISREVALWNPSLMSADSEILPERDLINARGRDTLRNDSNVASGLDIHRDNIVGSMFMLNSKPNAKVLGLDETWSQEFQAEVESKFTLYAESHNNWIDAARQSTLTGLVRLGMASAFMTGELLTSVEWLRDTTTNRPFNTAFQAIDTDRLSDPPEALGTFNIRGGVERNMFGAPLAYYIRSAHPGDIYTADRFFHKRVPARKPWGRLQMIHLFEPARPDQTRGVTALVTALKELRMTKRFKEIVLQNAVVNATFAASIESELPPEVAMAAIGAESGFKGNGFESFAASYLGAVDTYQGNSKNLQLDGVKIPHLFPGTKLKLTPAGNGGPLGDNFERSLIRYIAATLGLSYEQLSRDYSQSNYSSIRAALSETWKYMQSRKKLLADRYASIMFNLWLEEAINKKEIDSMPRNAPNWYEGLNAEAYSNCEWIGASRGQIDELKETQAAVLRMKNNLSTLEEESGRLGKDWRQILVQRERETKEMESRGILPVEDNMVNAVSGSEREAKDSNGDEKTRDEDE